MARTIDNLGVDSSNRYADDQKKYDAAYLKESGTIPQRTEIDVTIPSFASEWEKIFGMENRPQFWADFYPPTGYFEQKKRLFTHQIIPSLGSEEKNEAHAQKISALIPQMEKKIEEQKEKEKKEGKKRTFNFAWEEAREKEEEIKEKNTLIALLHCISNLDKHLIEINARRGQYQKG